MDHRVGVWSLFDCVQGKYMRFEPDSDQTKVWELMIDVWKFQRPSIVLSVTGGAVAEHYRNDYLKKALKKLISDTSNISSHIVSYVLEYRVGRGLHAVI